LREGKPKHPVLIVGGGPVGLALAIELGWRGVPCTLLEQGDGTVAIPKMNEVNIRTMEFCRRWGTAQAVHDCPFPPDYALDVVFITSLTAPEIARMPLPPRGSPPGPQSPVRMQVCSQMWFEPMLRARALSFPHVTLRYHTRLESFTTSMHGVSAEVVDLTSGQRERLDAPYLVGCDGANSTVRAGLGIGLTGRGILDHSLNLFFRAPDLLAR